jgi:hypothetical protein
MTQILQPSSLRAPFARSTIRIGGTEYAVRVDPVSKQRFIGDKTVEQFIEHLTVLGRFEDLLALRNRGYRAGRADERPPSTPFDLHRARRRKVWA